MKTLKQLARQTTKERKQKAQYVKIIATKIGHNRKGQGYVAAKTYSMFVIDKDGRLVKNPNKTYYVSMITFVDKKLNCILSCSCGDNTFRWEASNSYKGAANIEYSNGEPPVVTNPTFAIGACKHLYALMIKINPKLPPDHQIL